MGLEAIEKENEELRRRSDALLEELGITREYAEHHSFYEVGRRLGINGVKPSYVANRLKQRHNADDYIYLL